MLEHCLLYGFSIVNVKFEKKGINDDNFGSKRFQFDRKY